MRSSTLGLRVMRASLHPRSHRAMSTTTATAKTAEAAAAANDKSLADRIAARVQERDSWPTSHSPTRSEIFKFIRKNGFSLPKLPSKEELDRDFPVLPIDWEKLQNPPSPLQVTWIGHATCLVQMGGFSILTDPIFSNRCSIVQFAGPERYRPPACTCEELLKNIDLDVVLISHNHYDHLDYNSIVDLSQKSRKPLTFFVPLGLAEWLEKYISGISRRHKIIELDWHESHNVAGSGETTSNKEGQDDELAVTAIPAQHWSSRLGWDRDQTLWCGYTLRTRNKSTIFPGDTGWFDGLNDIGTQYGPFDLALLPIGAYEPRSFMKSRHTNPSDAVKMMTAIQAAKAVPIHWGTFQLTREPCLEPREKLAEAVNKAGLEPTSFDSWLIGETVAVEKKE